MLTIYDNIVIATYFLLMISVGVAFKKFNKNTSDYFRGGGSMLWWLVGSTTFISFISAVTYTGAAGKAYETGTFVMVAYIGNATGFLVSYLYFSSRFRQTRVVTAIEVVRERFGKLNEQFFTWMVVPFGVIHGGVWLFSLGIIVSTVFGVDIYLTIISVQHWNCGAFYVISWGFLGSSCKRFYAGNDNGSDSNCTFSFIIKTCWGCW